VSKFLLNLLVQISKALVNSKIQFLIRKSFFLFTSHFQPSWPYRPTWPSAQPAPPASLPRRLKPYSPAHLAHVSMASPQKYIFLFGSCLPSWSCSLSSLSVKWTRLSVPSSSPRRPTLTALPPPFAAPGRAPRPARHLEMPPSCLNPPPP
jgi:hypothetical protein